MVLKRGVFIAANMLLNNDLIDKREDALTRDLQVSVRRNPLLGVGPRWVALLGEDNGSKMLPEGDTWECR